MFCLLHLSHASTRGQSRDKEDMIDEEGRQKERQESEREEAMPAERHSAPCKKANAGEEESGRQRIMMQA